MDNKCERCLNLHYRVFENIPASRVEDISYRCQKGHFDKFGHPHYYAWSGIIKPNKAVASAQEKCGYDYSQSSSSCHRKEEHNAVG